MDQIDLLTLKTTRSAIVIALHHKHFLKSNVRKQKSTFKTEVNARKERSQIRVMNKLSYCLKTCRILFLLFESQKLL